MADTASVFPPNTPASSASTAGTLSVADFNKLATVPTGDALQVFYVSALIDFATTSTGVVIFPAKPGYYVRPGICFWYPISVAGSLSTSPTFQAGSDGSHVNWMASQTPSGAAAFAAFSAGVQTQGVNATIVAPSPHVNSDITLNVTVAATGTGGFALTGKFVTFGYLIPQS